MNIPVAMIRYVLPEEVRGWLGHNTAKRYKWYNGSCGLCVTIIIKSNFVVSFYCIFRIVPYTLWILLRHGSLLCVIKQ